MRLDGTVDRRAVYDDFEYAAGDDNAVENEGFFSPFTFLCFILVLTLFGLLSLFSASYDAALREGGTFYSLFLYQILGLGLGAVVGLGMCFMPLNVLRRSWFLLLPLYAVSAVLLAFETAVMYSDSFIQTTGLIGTVSAVFMLSDLVPRIGKREKSGLRLIVLVLGLVFTAVSQALLCGSGWYILTCLVIISSLLSMKTKRSYVLYYILCMFLLLVILTVSSPVLLETFTDTLFSGSTTTEVYLSECAIREGGMTGTGIGNGLYKLGIIRDAEGEYIFATISEETGIIGLVVILFSSVMIMIIGYRSSSRSLRRDDMFVSSFTLSSVTMIVFSLFVNMLYVSGLSPFDGVPLLLFSYSPVNEGITTVMVVLLFKFIFRTGRTVGK